MPTIDHAVRSTIVFRHHVSVVCRGLSKANAKGRDRPLPFLLPRSTASPMFVDGCLLARAPLRLTLTHYNPTHAQTSQAQGESSTLAVIVVVAGERSRENADKTTIVEAALKASANGMMEGHDDDFSMAPALGEAASWLLPVAAATNAVDDVVDAMDVVEAETPAAASVVAPTTAPAEQEDSTTAPSTPTPMTQQALIGHIAHIQVAAIQAQTNQLRELVQGMARAPWPTSNCGSGGGGDTSAADPPSAEFLYRRRPKARVQQAPIIDELEAQLLQCLDTRGRVSREKDADTLLDLMLQATRDESKVLLVEVLRSAADPAVLERLIHNGVLRVLKHWVLSYDKDVADHEILRLLLETLRDLPVTYDSLKASGLAKLINKIKKEKLKRGGSKGVGGGGKVEKEREALGKLSEAVKTKWKVRLEMMVEESNAPLPPPPLPAPSSLLSADVKKRKSDNRGEDKEVEEEGGGEGEGEGKGDAVDSAAAVTATVTAEAVSTGALLSVKPVKTTTAAQIRDKRKPPTTTAASAAAGAAAIPLVVEKKRSAVSLEQQQQQKKGRTTPTFKVSTTVVAAAARGTASAGGERKDEKKKKKGKQRVSWSDQKGAELTQVRIFEVEEEDEEAGGVGGVGGGGEEEGGNRHDRIRALAMLERQKEMELFKKGGGGGGRGGELSAGGWGKRGLVGGKSGGRAEGKAGQAVLAPTTAWRTPPRLVIRREDDDDRGGGGREERKAKVTTTPETVRLEAEQKGRLEMHYIREGDIPPTPMEGGSVREPQEDFVVITTSAFMFPVMEDGDGAPLSPMENAISSANGGGVLSVLPPWVQDRLAANGNELLQLCYHPGGGGGLDERKMRDLTRLLMAAAGAGLEVHVQIRLCRDVSRFLPCLRSDGSLDMGLMARAFADEEKQQQQQQQWEQQHQRGGGAPFYGGKGGVGGRGGVNPSMFEPPPLEPNYPPPSHSLRPRLPHGAPPPGRHHYQAQHHQQQQQKQQLQQQKQPHEHVPRYWKPCKYFNPNKAGSCRFGDRCQFVHDGVSVQRRDPRQLGGGI